MATREAACKAPTEETEGTVNEEAPQVLLVHAN